MIVGTLIALENSTLTISKNGSISSESSSSWINRGLVVLGDSFVDYPIGGSFCDLEIAGAVDFGEDSLWNITKRLKMSSNAFIVRGGFLYENDSVLEYSAGYDVDIVTGKEWHINAVPYNVLLSKSNVLIRDN